MSNVYLKRKIKTSLKKTNEDVCYYVVRNDLAVFFYIHYNVAFVNKRIFLY